MSKIEKFSKIEKNRNFEKIEILKKIRDVTRKTGLFSSENAAWKNEISDSWLAYFDFLFFWAGGR